jgi:hypothetical protein
MTDPESQGRRRRRFVERIAALRPPDVRRQGPPEAIDLASLSRRIDQLEATLEGLQDSVYRESKRHEADIQELQRQIEPGALSQAIEAHARKRGL